MCIRIGKWAALALSLSASTILAPAYADTSSAGSAPGAPGTAADWLPANKTGFGTAYGGKASTIWFTLRQGQMSEVYYPDLSTPSIRSLDFVVSDGNSFAELDSQPQNKFVEQNGPDAPVYRQIIQDPQGRWRLVKTYLTNPWQAAVMVDVSFTSLTGAPYQLYAVLHPQLNNAVDADSGYSDGAALVATGSTMASAMAASPAFSATSSGFAGVSDGWTLLKSSYALTPYSRADSGNVVQTGQLALNGTTSQHALIAIGMGAAAAAAESAANHSLGLGFTAAAVQYGAAWKNYLRGLKAPPGALLTAQEREVYQNSVEMLAASEDKLHPGAFIASPSMPWAFGSNSQFSPSGSYHLVWPRDLYQMATALIADGDTAAANRALSFMFNTQQQADGHLPQNTLVNGTPFWTGIQLDETAFPIVLAMQLGRTDAATWAHVQKAAGFLLSFQQDGYGAPYTGQERWEEQSGYSPSTIAAAIAGLVCAARIAMDNGASAAAASYLKAAVAWRSSLATWTVTSNGPLSNKPYFVRLTKNGDADAAYAYSLSNASITADQRAVVDAGFLELVRLGIYPANDPTIRNSLAVVDAQISELTPNGRFWHRYSDDGYGEQPNGQPWNDTFAAGSRATEGRLWTLLAGERGEYELLNGQPQRAAKRLRDMAATAGEGAILSEQVWDNALPVGLPGYSAGTSTTSASPLAWTHAQYIRLAWSLQAGRPVEYPAAVACYFLRTSCRP